jgi:hypothetical protein
LNANAWNFGGPAGAAGPVYDSKDRGKWALVAELTPSHVEQAVLAMAM